MLGPCGIWIEQASSSATTSVPKERASLVAWHLGGFLQRKALSHTPLERPAISISSKATAGVASSSSLGMPVEGTQLPASQQSGVSGVSYKLDVHASGQDTPSPSRQDSLSRLLAVGRSPVRAASSHSPFASPSRLRPESRWRVPRPVARSAAAPMSASLPSPSTQFSPAEEGILPEWLSAYGLMTGRISASGVLGMDSFATEDSRTSAPACILGPGSFRKEQDWLYSVVAYESSDTTLGSTTESGHRPPLSPLADRASA